MSAPGSPPAFTVVVPTHDRRELLPRAVASVLAQGRRDLELVVVDDGSRDGTAEWLAAQAESRLSWLREPHRGASAARNRGARQARGEHLVFLDSDDELAPEALDRFAAALGAGAALACGAVACRPEGPGDDEGDDEATLLPPEPWGEPFAGRRISTLAGSFAVRRDLFAAAGGYSEELAYGENSELVLRLVAACEERGLAVAAFDEPTVIYRRAERVRDRRRVEEQLRASEYLLRHHGEIYRRQPRLIAQVRGNAGVRAARLGRYRDARRHFWGALRDAPSDWRAAARLALVLVPGLRRRVWRPLPPAPDPAAAAAPGRPRGAGPGAGAGGEAP